MVEKLNNEANEKITELKNLEVEVVQQRNTKEKVLEEVKAMVWECEELQRRRTAITREIQELKERVDSLQR